MKSTTCIVGWIDNSKKGITRIWMGADSQVSSSAVFSKAHGYEKIFENTDFLLGVSGDVYAANLLHHVWTPPTRKEGQTTTNYLYNDVIPSIRTLFKTHGHTKVTDNQEQISENIMLAYEGKLYTLHIDFCLLESLRKFDAVGCGMTYALGACYILEKSNKSINYEGSIQRAIYAASEFSMGVDARVLIKCKEWKNIKEKK